MCSGGVGDRASAGAARAGWRTSPAAAPAAVVAAATSGQHQRQHLRSVLVELAQRVDS